MNEHDQAMINHINHFWFDDDQSEKLARDQRLDPPPMH